jgi:hypothetical protein
MYTFDYYQLEVVEIIRLHSLFMHLTLGGDETVDICEPLTVNRTSATLDKTLYINVFGAEDRHIKAIKSLSLRQI